MSHRQPAVRVVKHYLHGCRHDRMPNALLCDTAWWHVNLAEAARLTRLVAFCHIWQAGIQIGCWLHRVQGRWTHVQQLLPLLGRDLCKYVIQYESDGCMRMTLQVSTRSGHLAAQQHMQHDEPAYHGRS